jgi:uncharacterized membrane protein
MFYAKQSLVVFIVSCIAGIIASGVWVIPIIGWIIHFALNVIGFLAWLISWIYSLSGEMKEVPIIGVYAKKFKL